MARYYDDDDRYPHHYQDGDHRDTEEEDTEEDEDYLEEEDDIGRQEPDSDELYYDDTIIPTEWKLLKLGDARIRISNEGKIHYLDLSPFYVTSGLRETGTPYRFIQLEVFKGDIRKYYVHDLVWRAFNMEDPPEGWEVRHMNHVPMEENHCYENHLQYLDIFPKNVCTEYQIAKII
jgi:hypothetical protein